jgi:Flp pilus assembly protein TadD
MSKRRPRKQRSVRSERPRRRPADELERTLARAEHMIEENRPQEALQLMMPLVESYPREPEAHYMLGYARAGTGDTWGALEEFERAMELGRDPRYWPPLASLYIELELNAHALGAFRQAMRHPEQIPPELRTRVPQVIAALRKQVAEMSRSLGISEGQMEKGLYEMEEGIRAMNQGDYPSSAAASRRASRLLGDWPPPHNNLSLALFYAGHAEDAVAAARRVLAHDPDNIQALSNAIRFLAWSDREQEARALWARLEHAKPQDTVERVKAAEAAAILGEDESVYRLLRPLDRPSAELLPAFASEVQFFLAVAEANTGRRGAKRRLQEVRDRYPQVDRFLAALDDKRPGPGWSQRYPYFASSELLPVRAMQEWVDLAERQEHMPEERFHDEAARFAERFPQIVRAAEKMIWEEDQVDVGLSMLILFDTRQARAALRRFGLSQAGEYSARMDALNRLADVGEIGPDTTLRVWMHGEWREVQLRRYEVSDEHVSEYEPEVAGLLDAGLKAFQEEKVEEAQRLFEQALELDPRVKEAYNNLGAIYSQQGNEEQARKALRAALEIDPLYAMPRCNLALSMLGDGDIEGADEMLRPLVDVSHFHPQAMSFYAYVQARILVEREDFEAARRSLEMALEIMPDYKLAKELLDQLDLLESTHSMRKYAAAFVEEQRERNRARRIRLQTALTTPDPSLPRALAIYTKDALTGMAREVIPWGGWSTLRKAELIEAIANVLEDAELLAKVVEDLEDKERAALGEVLGRGGTMPWAEFDARYGNDLEESPYWNYHEPKTVMGRLRERGLLVEATAGGERLVAVPVELRALLAERDS